MILSKIKYAVISLACAIVFFCGFSTYAQNEKTDIVEAKLLKKYHQATDAFEKMSTLTHLADLNFGQPKELEYLKELYNITKVKNPQANKYRAVAISQIARYYFNTNDTDSLLTWASRADEIKLEPKLYSRYFDTKYYHCYGELDRGNIEKALELALQLQEKAHQLHSEDGEVTCYEILGDIYMKSKAYDYAITSYSSGFDILKKNEKRPSYQFQLTTSLLECCIMSGNYEVFKKYLTEMESIFITGGIPQSSGALYVRCYKLYNAYALLYSIKQNDSAAAKKYFTMLQGFAKIDDWFVEDRTTRTVVDYYDLIGEYDLALKELSKLEDSSIDSKINLLYTAGTILQKAKRFEEACINFYQSYDFLYTETQKAKILEFVKFQDICHEQYKTRINKEYIDNKQRTKNIYSTIGLLVALIFLGLFAYHVKKTRQLNKRLSDLSNRLQAEEQDLIERQKVLRESLEKQMNNGQAKTMFLSSMSHEIRNPLNAIMGFSDILALNAGDNDIQREYVKIIKENSASLMTLINNVLDLGRLDSNRMYLNWERVNILEIINKELFQYAGSDVASIVEADDKEIYIATDILRLSKVFENLYSNAFKFTKQGHVKTIVKKEKNKLNIRIEDTGIGVPIDKQELIFERFEKIDTFVSGSGLGLSICREILKRMGGTIHTDSSYTNGLAIVIDLPIIPTANIAK